MKKWNQALLLTTQTLFHNSMAVEGNIEENNVTMPWTMPIFTSGTNVAQKLDTGCQVNIIPQKIYHALQNNPRLHQAKEKLANGL